ncbi:hypothetical protein GQ600_6398 [Phytophthora cactorum]|nr:hypothetical protein GQ600_6398 [Phytophthora cactorum]
MRFGSNRLQFVLASDASALTECGSKLVVGKAMHPSASVEYYASLIAVNRDILLPRRVLVYAPHYIEEKVDQIAGPEHDCTLRDLTYFGYETLTKHSFIKIYGREQQKRCGPFKIPKTSQKRPTANSLDYGVEFTVASTHGLSIVKWNYMHITRSRQSLFRQDRLRVYSKLAFEVWRERKQADASLGALFWKASMLHRQRFQPPLLCTNCDETMRRRHEDVISQGQYSRRQPLIVNQDPSSAKVRTRKRR